ncbi:hypothetical protein TUM17378_03040 [Shewanella algae]|nr:hypothetical protein TUM17378_03040 [Shewanella algae]
MSKDSLRDQQISETQNTRKERLKKYLHYFCTAALWVYRVWRVLDQEADTSSWVE